MLKLIIHIRLLFNSVDRYIRNGSRFMDKGEYAKAINAFTRAKRIAYGKKKFDRKLLSKICLLRGKAFLKCGEKLLAKGDFEQSWRFNPENESIQTLLANL